MTFEIVKVGKQIRVKLNGDINSIIDTTHEQSGFAMYKKYQEIKFWVEDVYGRSIDDVKGIELLRGDAVERLHT